MDSQKVLEAVASTDLGKALVAFLQKRGAVPAMKEGYLGNGGTLAEFSTNTPFGNELPKNGTVTFSYGFNPSVPSWRGTATHELMHAADRQMLDMYFSRPKDFWSNQTPTQFSEAYRKLRLTADPLVAKMPPQYKDAQKDYRLQLNEALAYGAGMAGGSNAYPVRLPSGGHLNATKATEASILLELANRMKESK